MNCAKIPYMTEAAPSTEHWDARQILKQLVEQTREGRYGIEHYARLPRTLELGAVQSRVEGLRSLTRERGVEAGMTLFYEPVTRKIHFSSEPVLGVSLDAEAAVSGRLQEGSNPGAPIDIGYEVSDQVFAESHRSMSADHMRLLTSVVEQLAQAPAPGDILFADSTMGELARAYVRRPLATIHTHPNEVPFSVGDVAQFLNELSATRLSFHILARPGGITEALVFTPETSRFDPETAQESYQRWDAAVDRRVAEVTGNQITPDRPQIFTRVSEAMLRTIAQKYRFGWYQSTEEAPNVLKRAA